HLQPRRAVRHRRAAVRPRRGAGHAVLPADRAGCRSPGEAAVGADPPDHPRRRGIGSFPMTVAILLLASLVLAAAVGVLAVALRELRDRVRVLEVARVPDVCLVPGAGAPSLGSESAPAPSSTSADEDFVITRLGVEPESEPV